MRLNIELFLRDYINFVFKYCRNYMNVIFMFISCQKVNKNCYRMVGCFEFLVIHT